MSFHYIVSLAAMWYNSPHQDSVPNNAIEKNNLLSILTPTYPATTTTAHQPREQDKVLAVHPI